MRLAEHTTETAAELLGPDTVAVLPVGSIEQHGPALPLGTDMLAADAIAAAIDRDEVVVLPTIPVGVSAHHQQFYGTLSVSPDTLEAYLTDVLESVADHGVQKAVIVNGHGGNTDVLARVARSVRDAGVLFAVPWNWWDNLDDLIAEQLDTSLGHADAVETSVLLHLTDLVRESELDRAEADAVESWGTEVAGASVGFDTIDFAANGVTGAPTTGTAAIGEQLVAAATEDLNTIIDWLTTQDYADLQPKPHR